MKVYKLTPGPSLNPCVERDLRDLLQWFDDAEPGEKMTVEVLEMTEGEYADLPEYMGP